MRRSTLPLLHCPACLAGPLEAEDDRPVIEFGPVRCASCGTAWPMAEGLLDLLGVPESPVTPASRLLDTRAVARVWERGVRGAVLGHSRSRLDPDGEGLLIRSLLDPAPGAPIAELDCRTATQATRLAFLAGSGPVIGVESSRPMIEEALHQIREAAAPVDLIRAAPASLPFRDGVLGGVVWIGALQLVADPAPLFAEVARTLAPGARLVVGTLVPGRLLPLRRLESPLGLHRRDEAELRRLTSEAGLSSFEAIRLPPALFFRVQRPPDH